MLVWFCDGMLFENQIPLFRDLGPYFYPIKSSVADAFRAGEIPLWQRKMAGGFPVLAGLQSAVFYPASLLFAALPFFTAIQLTFIIHFAVAAFASCALFRWWNTPIYISIIGAVLFTFGGALVSLTNLLNHFQSAVWLPWVILMWERILSEWRWRRFVCLTLLLVCQLLAGSPEVFVFSLGILLVDTFRLRTEGKIRSLITATPIMIAAIVVVMGLSMVQLLPTSELIANSRRNQSIPMAEALAWSLPPSRLIGLVIPSVETDTSSSLGLRLLFSPEVPLFLSYYIGGVAFFGVCSWFVHATLKARVILLLLITALLFLAFGKYTPVYPFLYDHISLLRMVRFPEKLFFLCFVLLIFAAVRGLGVLEESKSHYWPSGLAVGILVVWSAIYALFSWQTGMLAQLLGSPGPDNVILPATAPTLASIYFNLEKQIAISFIIAALFICYRGNWLRATLFQILLVATAFADLSIAHKPLQFLREKEFITDAARVLDKPPTEPSRIFYYPPGPNLHPSFVSVRGKPTFDQATQLPFNNLVPNAGVFYGFEYFQDIDALSLRAYNDFLDFANPLASEKRAKLLGALNIKYVVSFRQLEIPGLTLVRQNPEQLSWLYEVSAFVPRAYIVSDAVYEKGPRRTMERLTSAPFDLSRQVVLDAPTSIKASRQSVSETKITSYQNREVHLSARLQNPGILVLADTYYPGWRVYVDGDERPVLRANHFFRAVELPAGNHWVKFTYDPISFKLGAIISTLTASLMALMSIVVYVRRRKQLPRIVPD